MKYILLLALVFAISSTAIAQTTYTVEPRLHGIQDTAKKITEGYDNGIMSISLFDNFDLLLKAKNKDYSIKCTSRLSPEERKIADGLKASMDLEDLNAVSVISTDYDIEGSDLAMVCNFFTTDKDDQSYIHLMLLFGDPKNEILPIRKIEFITLDITSK